MMWFFIIGGPLAVIGLIALFNTLFTTNSCDFGDY